MTTQQADIAAAPSELALLASLDGRKLPRVEIVAYTGGVMSVPGWGDVAIDLSGLLIRNRFSGARAPARLPVRVRTQTG